MAQYSRSAEGWGCPGHIAQPEGRVGYPEMIFDQQPTFSAAQTAEGGPFYGQGSATIDVAGCSPLVGLFAGPGVY